MKIIPYTTLRKEYDYENTRGIAAKLWKEEDSDDFDDIARMMTGVGGILALGLSLDNLHVLDLGCGNPYGRRDGDLYPPVVCRTLKRLGAHPIGIDLGSNEGEAFEHYQRNLWEPDALSMIPDSSIDVALSVGLIDSPMLTHSYRGSKFANDEQITREFMSVLLPQLERIVKPDGYFIYGDVVGSVPYSRVPLHEMER